MNRKPSHMGEGSIIDASPRPLIGYRRDPIEQESSFGKNVWIGAHCIVGRGVIVGDNVVLSDGSHVEERVRIDDNTLLTYRCIVGSDSIIGNNCIIGGFVGERTKIGNRCRIFGAILHHHVDPTKDWDAPSSIEEGACIESMVFLGFGAKITRPIRVSNNVYICPNSIVSVDVPPYHIVHGVNKIVPAKDWKGELARSPFFETRLL